VDELKAGWLKVLEAGIQTLTRILEAVSWVWMRWRLAWASRGYSIAVDEVVAGLSK
jgi:hypothetical protein